MSKKNAPITIEDLNLSEKDMEALVKGAQRFLPAEDPREDEVQVSPESGVSPDGETALSSETEY